MYASTCIASADSSTSRNTIAEGVTSLLFSELLDANAALRSVVIGRSTSLKLRLVPQLSLLPLPILNTNAIKIGTILASASSSYRDKTDGKSIVLCFTTTVQSSSTQMKGAINVVGAGTSSM